MTRDYPDRTGQNGSKERGGPRGTAGRMPAWLRLELLDLVAEQRGRDRRLARLALQEGLSELLRLLVLDLARQRRLVRVDVHVHDGRAVVGQRLGDRGAGIAGPLHLGAQRPV